MKKRICYFIMAALIACSMVMPCYADEVDVTEPIETTVAETTVAVTEESVEETVAETPTETATETAEATETPVEGSNTPVEETPTEEAETPSIDFAELKAKITDSATWTMLGSAIVTVITVVGVVASKFSGVATLLETLKGVLSGKANKEDVDGALDNVKESLTKEFKEAYVKNFDSLTAMLKRQEEALKTTQENEQKLYAMLTLFMTNCKISESAKAEILNLAADVKKYEGDVFEVVGQAQEVIDADIAEKEKDAPATPVLDEIIQEYMELG